MTVPAPRKYPQELRERAMRLVQEAREQHPELSQIAAVVRIGQRVGSTPTRCVGGASRPTSTLVDALGPRLRIRSGSRSSSVRSRS